jgi:hypothetical protein
MRTFFLTLAAMNFVSAALTLGAVGVLAFTVGCGMVTTGLVWGGADDEDDE